MTRTIQISGAGHRNKGALLMLATVARVLRQHDPQVRLALPMREMPFAIRAHYNLHYTLPPGPSLLTPRSLIKDFFSSLRGKLITRSWRDRLGLVTENELDANIDVSGYAFGDKWPAQRTYALAAQSRSLAARGKPTILLPQTLGPFKRPQMARAFQKLSQYVKLIYAREVESFEFARPLVTGDLLHLAPDITISTPGTHCEPDPRPYACIVPNSKLLEPNPQQQDWGKQYVSLLVLACQTLLQQGLAVKVVLHEHDGKDVELANTIHQQVASPGCTQVTHWDPCVLKGILSQAQVVVGSRFHALVSSLSSAVPCIALGWSHKYDALMRQFGTPDLLHYADQPAEHLADLIRQTLNNHDTLRHSLQVAKTQLAAENAKMWTQVLATIGMRGP